MGLTENDSTTGRSAPPEAKAQSEAKEKFNKDLYSKDSASSLWVVVNKGRILPRSYVPSGLTAPGTLSRLGPASTEMYMRADAANALKSLFDSAASESVYLMLASAYRSYASQAALYSGYVRTQGQAVADASSARPGHSEHQTGLTADVEPANRKCEIDVCFADTAEGQWVAANAYKHGFIVRYERGKENLTGYEYEPWHIRYVGRELAAEIHAGNQTMEQFFGLPAQPDYPASPYQLAP